MTSLYAALYIAKKTLSAHKNAIEEKNKELRTVISLRIEHYLEKKKDGISIVKNTDLDEVVGTKGFYKIDFGVGMRMDAYVNDEKFILFTYREELKKSTLPITLIGKDDLAVFFEIPKKEATLHAIAEKLNGMVNKNFLKINEGNPYLVASRGKRIDLEVALDNVLIPENSIWKAELSHIIDELQLINNYGESNEARKKQIDRIEGILEKLSSKIMGAEAFEENPYLSVQRGRVSFDRESEEAFIRELEEVNMNVALKITKEGRGDERLTIKGEFTIDEAMSLSPALKKFLDYEYKQKTEYLAKKENERSADISPSIALKR